MPNLKPKINIHFIAVECYPAAKVGGLADVVGALPKYLNKIGCKTNVFIPHYSMPYFISHQNEKVFSGELMLGQIKLNFEVLHILDEGLHYDLFTINIPGLFDRYGVYADEGGTFFEDEVERFIAFQRAYLDYILQLENQPDIIHIHDHHTGLIPFMINYCDIYFALRQIPLVLTIHNQRYQGQFPWSKVYLLPPFRDSAHGLLDWDHQINPLASAVKCSWKITTVSPSYMEELLVNSYGLEWLFNNEINKSIGILNGIDYEVWNPKKDDLLPYTLKSSIRKFKLENKKELLKDSGLNVNLPLVSFIGRFALEKGADLLPEIMEVALHNDQKINFLVLGTGDSTMEESLKRMGNKYPDYIRVHITYDERLSHIIYAGSDFLIMPSRVEPCGLNQMYAMRYGTIPIVHDIGGLSDSVTKITDNGGNGIKFENLETHKIAEALTSALHLYEDNDQLISVREKAMATELSWDNSANQYLDIYLSLLNEK